jgi:hypothetical protein
LKVNKFQIQKQTKKENETKINRKTNKEKEQKKRRRNSCFENRIMGLARQRSLHAAQFSGSLTGGV